MPRGLEVKLDTMTSPEKFTLDTQTRTPVLLDTIKGKYQAMAKFDKITTEVQLQTSYLGTLFLTF